MVLKIMLTDNAEGLGWIYIFLAFYIPLSPSPSLSLSLPKPSLYILELTSTYLNSPLPSLSIFTPPPSPQQLISSHSGAGLSLFVYYFRGLTSSPEVFTLAPDSRRILAASTNGWRNARCKGVLPCIRKLMV